MRKTIVIGGGINVLGLARSLGEKGVRVYAIDETHDKTSILQFSKYVTKAYTLCDGDIFSILAKYFWKEPEKTLLFLGSDSAIQVIDRNYEIIKEHFITFNARETGVISKYMDKNETFALAEACGLNIINTRVISAGAEISEDVNYPCLIKGLNSTKSTKGDMFICSNRAELESHLNEEIEYLLQDYIVKDYELDVVGLSLNHGEEVYIPAVVRKIRDSLYRQSDYIKIEDVSEYPNLNIGGIKDLVKSIGYEGIFSVEFLCKGDKYYFLEINLRNDGTSYLYTAAGVNYPWLWYQYATAGKNLTSIQEQVKCPMYLMQMDDIKNVLNKSVTLVQWMKDLCRTRAFFLWNVRDMKPFFYANIMRVYKHMFRIR